ncbi:TRAP transporter small permease [Ferviditalea candida]|uniref:TRAP transporter small permease n=1 Tax=Ferviditalea candida TaxID=3108399 RepID=A0ABU5ZMX7_9BACL|nr:TRAP transporter small permease [Paenibacillaceae bacterium T2]
MWLRRLGKAEEFLSGLLFVSGVLVSLYAVIMRYIFNMPPAWSLEIFEFLMVWSVFIGFAIALRSNHHIVVDLLYDKLSYPVKRFVSTLSNLIGAGYSIFMTITGIKMIALAYEQKIVTIDVGIPIWITYVIMPVGMALMALYFFVKAFKAIKGDREEIMGHIDHEQYLKETQGKGGLGV